MTHPIRSLLAACLAGCLALGAAPARAVPSTVKGACDGVQMGTLTKTLALLAPALAASEDRPGAHDPSNAGYVEHVTEANVRFTAAAMVERSPILASLVREGRIYDVSSGRVAFLAGGKP